MFSRIQLAWFAGTVVQNAMRGYLLVERRKCDHFSILEQGARYVASRAFIRGIDSDQQAVFAFPKAASKHMTLFYLRRFSEQKSPES